MTNSEEIDMLRKLYPSLTDEQLEEAKQNLEDYLGLVMRIFERLNK